MGEQAIINQLICYLVIGYISKSMFDLGAKLKYLSPLQSLGINLLKRQSAVLRYAYTYFDDF